MLYTCNVENVGGPGDEASDFPLTCLMTLVVALMHYNNILHCSARLMINIGPDVVTVYLSSRDLLLLHHLTAITF